MKKSVRIALIAAAALVTAGLILGIIGAALAGSSIGNIIKKSADLGDLVEKTLVLSDGELSEVTLNLVSYKITFVTTEDETASIVYTQYENDDIRTVNTDGRLELHEESRDGNVFRKLARIFSKIKRSQRTCEVRIPKGASPDISVDNVNGNVDFDGISAGRFTVESVNSKLSGRNLSISGKLNISCVNGEILIETAKADSIKANIVNGSITLTDICSDSIEAETVNGPVNCTVSGNRNDYAVVFDTVNGSLTIGKDKTKGSASINKGAAKRIFINTVNGSGYVAFVEGEKSLPASVLIRILSDVSGKEALWREKTVTDSGDIALIMSALEAVKYSEGDAEGTVDLVVEYTSDKAHRYEFSKAGAIIDGKEYRTDNGAADELRALYEKLK